MRNILRYTQTKHRPVGTRGEESYQTRLHVDITQVLGVGEHDGKAILYVSHGHEFYIDQPAERVLSDMRQYWRGE